MISFAAPWAFTLLIAPLLMRLLPARRASATSLALPPALSTMLQPRPVALLPKATEWAGVLAWLLLVTAAAQPQWPEFKPDLSATDRDILLTLDMSGSMAKEDFSLDGQKISRLDAVRKVASEFIQGRQGDRVGIVVFADHAYVASPLSHDLTAVVRSLDETQIGLTGQSTAISDGLGLAIKRSLASDATTKIILLLSDGRDTAARLDARDVGRLAQSQNIRIHSIALGPDDTETKPNSRDAVDTTLLREVAQNSGGEMFRVRSLSDLEAMAARLDEIEPNPALRPARAFYRPLWTFAAALAGLVLLVIGLRRFRI